MAAVKAARPTDIFPQQTWAALTQVSPWRGLWLIAHGWIVVLLVAGLAAACPMPFAPLAWLLAIILLGGRQLGLAILMHEAAHGLTHPNRALNNFAGQWLAGAAAGSDLHSYRAYHLSHHKYTQQPEDPDLGLSKPFPTNAASLRRKFMRDLTGQTFFKQRSAQFGMALIGLKAMIQGEAEQKSGRRNAAAGTPFNKTGITAGISAPMADASDAAAAIDVARTTGRFLVVQAVLLTLSLLSGLGVLPYALWLIALATTFQLFLRIRNIAEHACTSTGSADPFTHARATYANWAERATVAPYWVNYHAEHHLFMGVPCYRLKAAHDYLGGQGHHDRMTIAPDYASVLRIVTAS